MSNLSRNNRAAKREIDMLQTQNEEEMLSTEIEFWRDMIESRRGTVSEQITERMLNARELAERKLLMVQGEPYSTGQTQ